MDIEGTWATQAYSSDVAESDVSRYSSTAGPSFEGAEVITIQDDDEVDPPILIADGAAEVNNRPKPEVIVIEDDDEVDAPTATAGYAAEVANGSEPLQAQAPSAVQRSDAHANAQPGAASTVNPTNIQSSQETHAVGPPASTTQASQIPNPPANSRLLSLPPEIRNIIWTYTVTDEGKVIHLSRREWFDTELRARLNITLTNRQIRHESLLMFYASNTFLTRAKVYPSKVPLAGAATWLGGLKAQYRQMLGRVVVCTKIEGEEGVKNEWEKEDERYGFEVRGSVDVGCEQGHHCNDKHYLLSCESEDEAEEAGDGENEDEGESDAEE